MQTHTARLLKSVGKELFVSHFDQWTTPGINAALKAKRDYSENAINTRVLKACRILATRETTREALEIIVRSNATAETISAARRLLETFHA